MTDDSSGAEARELFFAEIQRLHENAHTANVMLMAASIDNLLERIIKSHMPRLSNTLADDLFSGYGPMATFRAKIDIAYAMGDIDAPLKTDLHIVRDIRNKFAHPKKPKFVTFDDAELAKPFSRFPDFTSDYEKRFGRQQFLVAKFKSILGRLGAAHESALLVQAIRSRTRKPSNGKSH